MAGKAKLLYKKDHGREKRQIRLRTRHIRTSVDEYFKDLSFNNERTQAERIERLEREHKQMRHLAKLWCDNVGLSIEWLRQD